MTTKGAKRRRQLARRKDGLPRTPSGQLSRSKGRYQAEGAQTAEAIISIAKEARMRRYGYTEEEATNPLAGSELGRLHLAGIITRAQYDAGMRWGEVCAAYYRTTGIAPPSPKALDYGGSRGRGSEASDETAKRASDRYMAALGVILQADSAGRPTSASLRQIVLEDAPTEHWHPAMYNHLRRGLEALREHFGISAGWASELLTALDGRAPQGPRP